MPGKFEIKSGKTGKFRFNLKASNGQVILTSEAYESSSAAKKGIASVQKNAGNAKRFDRRKAKDGSPYFVMTATNGQVIGKSEMYKTAKAMENGIASVAKHAAGASVSDGAAKPAAKAAAKPAAKPAAKKPAAKKAPAKKAAASKPAAKPAAKKAPAKKAAAPKKAAAKKPAAKKPAAKKAAKKK